MFVQPRCARRRRDDIAEVHVLVASHAMIDQVVVAATRILKERHDGEEDFTVTTPLWRWQSATAPAAWFFVTIAGEAADGIRLAAMTGQWLDGRRGFGSARVEARIGARVWRPRA